MESYSADPVWVKAKKMADSSDWIRVVMYYRSLGGKNVFVYALLDREKKLIVDVTDTGEVLLLTKAGIVTEDYERVFTSRKYFSFAELPVYRGKTYTVDKQEHHLYEEY